MYSTIPLFPGAGAGDQRQSGDPRIEPGRQNTAQQGDLLGWYAQGTILLIDLLYTGTEDLQDVRSALEPVIARWRPIGLALRLTSNRLDVINRDRGNCEDCLTEVLTLWLNRNYDTEQYGEPSWEMLARAVGHRAGGNDTALSQEITGRYCEVS